MKAIKGIVYYVLLVCNRMFLFLMFSVGAEILNHGK